MLTLTAICVSSAFSIFPQQQALTTLKIDTPSWRGELTVWVLPREDPSEFAVTLVGKLGVDKDDQAMADALISFDMPLPSTAPSKGQSGLMLQRPDDAPVLFRVDAIDEAVSVWSVGGRREAGSVEIWQADEDSQSLSSSMIAGLLSVIFLPDQGSRSSSCSVNLTTCISEAKAACLPGRLGSVQYSCNQSTKTATCNFTCLDPLPPSGDDDEP